MFFNPQKHFKVGLVGLLLAIVLCGLQSSAAGRIITAISPEVQNHRTRDLVLACGGQGRTGEVLSSCDLYDTLNGNWTTGDEFALHRGRYGFSLAVLGGGRVAFVTGGFHQPLPSDGGKNQIIPGRVERSVERLDVNDLQVAAAAAKDQNETAAGETLWRFVTPMMAARESHASAFLNGLLYVVGGLDRDGQELNSVERYDPVADRWDPSAALHVARVSPSAVGHGDHLYVVGGWDRFGAISLEHQQVERFDSTGTGRWELLGGPLVDPSRGLFISGGRAVLFRGDVHLIGAAKMNPSTGAMRTDRTLAYRLSLAEHKWLVGEANESSLELPVGREGMSATVYRTYNAATGTSTRPSTHEEHLLVAGGKVTLPSNLRSGLIASRISNQVLRTRSGDPDRQDRDGGRGRPDKATRWELLNDMAHERYSFGMGTLTMIHDQTADPVGGPSE